MPYSSGEKDAIMYAYFMKFGPYPLTGLTDEQVDKLVDEMVRALNGERAGDIEDDEIGGCPGGAVI